MGRRTPMEDNNHLSLDLIQCILLRVPPRDVVRFSCVSKLWLSLISDPTFRTLHLQLQLYPPRHRFFFINRSKAGSADVDSLFHSNSGDDSDDEDTTDFTYSLPLKQCPSRYLALTSYGGFILLYHHDCFIVWNPLTGSHRKISYPHRPWLLQDLILFAFGYDPSQDDYLLVLYLKNRDCIDFFSMRSNSWNILDVEFPLALRNASIRGIFLNGAIHWFLRNQSRSESILVFDLSKRSFSYILLPQSLRSLPTTRLSSVEGCLALTSHFGGRRTETWLMKEYNVQSSWTLYKIRDPYFEPLSLSNNGDIIGTEGPTWLSKYNVKGELLQHYHDEKYKSVHWFHSALYTECLMPVPNEEKKTGLMHYALSCNLQPRMMDINLTEDALEIGPNNFEDEDADQADSKVLQQGFYFYEVFKFIQNIMKEFFFGDYIMKDLKLLVYDVILTIKNTLR